MEFISIASIHKLTQQFNYIHIDFKISIEFPCGMPINRLGDTMRCDAIAWIDIFLKLFSSSISPINNIDSTPAIKRYHVMRFEKSLLQSRMIGFEIIWWMASARANEQVSAKWLS